MWLSPHAFTRSFSELRLEAVRVRSIIGILNTAKSVDELCVYSIPIALRVSKYTNISESSFLVGSKVDGA